ncbi:hypothetical protein M1614_00010 [Candidatus Marsarchaeota archaeon]|jgi:hypothetical protein|nr:hypothetical protein [Candidatus Marsarchaeota archaeon]
MAKGQNKDKLGKYSEGKSGKKSTAEVKNAKIQKIENNAAIEKKPNKIVVAAVIVVVIAVVFTALFSGIVSYHTTSFPEFKSNFDSAKMVSVYVNTENSSTTPFLINCEYQLVYQLTSSPTLHNNNATVNLFYVENNSCLFKQYSESSNSTATEKNLLANYTTISKSSCLNYSKTTPSIFLNYSKSASSTVITTPTKLYFIGNSTFLDACGIAYQIT